MTQPVQQMALMRSKSLERSKPVVELKVLKNDHLLKRPETINGGLTVEDAQVNQWVGASSLSQQHTCMTSGQYAISWREERDYLDFMVQWVFRTSKGNTLRTFSLCQFVIHLQPIHIYRDVDERLTQDGSK